MSTLSYAAMAAMPAPPAAPAAPAPPAEDAASPGDGAFFQSLPPSLSHNTRRLLIVFDVIGDLAVAVTHMRHALVI